MLKVIVSVKDNVSEIFNDPRVEVNTASAIRAFTNSVKETPYKDDFSLYQVGTFETNNGTVTPNEPLRIYTGHDVKTDNVVDLPNTLKKQSD